MMTLALHPDTTPGHGYAYGFVSAVPANYDPAGPLLPLVLFLPGNGELGNGDTDLVKVRRFALMAMLDSGELELPAVVLAPQCAKHWNYDALKRFVDRAVTQYRVDPTRVYGVGASFGGGGIWGLAGAYPELLAGIAVFAGSPPYPAQSHRITCPVWAFHSVGDGVVPLGITQTQLRALTGVEPFVGRSAGPAMREWDGATWRDWVPVLTANQRIRWPDSRIAVTLFESASHDCWTGVAGSTTFWGWLLSRGAPATTWEAYGIEASTPEHAAWLHVRDDREVLPLSEIVEVDGHVEIPGFGSWPVETRRVKVKASARVIE